MSTPMQETTKNTWSGKAGSWRVDNNQPLATASHSLDGTLDRNEVAQMLSKARDAAQGPQQNEVKDYVVADQPGGQVVELSYVSNNVRSKADYHAAHQLDESAVAQEMSTQYVLLHSPNTNADEPKTEKEREERRRNHQIFMNRYQLLRLLESMEQKIPDLPNRNRMSSLVEKHQHLENVHLLLSYSEPSVFIFIGLDQESQLKVGLARTDVVNSQFLSIVLTDWSFSAIFDEFFAQKRGIREIGVFFMERLKELDLPNKAMEFRKNPPLNTTKISF